MSLIDQIIQSQQHIIKHGIDVIKNQQNMYNEMGFYSIMAVGLIAVGIFIWNYKTSKRTNKITERSSG